MRRISALILVLAVAAAFGCGGGSNNNQAAQSPPEGSTPPAATSTPPAATSTPATPAETSAVLAKSKYDDGPRAGKSPANAALAASGEKLFQTKGCVVCHGFGKKVTCPDLVGVSMRRTSAWMEHQILHPEVMVKEDPISHELRTHYALPMTNQGVKPEEAKSLIEFLKKKDREAGVAGVVK